MEIRFTGQNLKITEGMKAHLQERLPKLEQYSPKLVEAHVFLKKEKYLFEAEVTLLARHLHAFGEGSSKENIFAAMNEAYDRVENQLKKFRAKTKDHHKETAKASAKLERAMDRSEAENAVKSARPKIMRVSTATSKPMSIEEASLQLGLSPESFLIFVESNTNRVHVIYKRKDGNHGLIEPGS